jgi:hypothetical protein
VYNPEPNGVLHCRLIAYTEGLGAQAAFYYLIQKANQEGYERLNYGAAPPLMNDGLFFYKKSLGMGIDQKLDSVLAVKICKFEKPVQEFLINNPLIFTDFENTLGLVTLSKSEKVNLSSLCQKYYLRGLQKLMLLYPEGYAERFPVLPSKSFHESKLCGLASLMRLARTMSYETGFIDFDTS